MGAKIGTVKYVAGDDTGTTTAIHVMSLFQRP